jgi:hypothetical protein
MGRTVHFDETEMVLLLSEWLSFLSFETKIVMPYKIIKNVTVDDFVPPRWMLRMPGTAIPFLHIYQGSFKYANEWYFLSYEKKESLVRIELEGHRKFKYVIFQIDNPTQIAAEIRKRIRDLG